jgi:membrane protein YdbS with pleckstrin-like domain
MTQTLPSEPGWQRLDPRMLAVTPLRQLAGFLPVIVVVVIGVGQDFGGRAYGLLVGVLLVLLAGVLRWLTTRYRITSERVELRSGLLFRNARSVPRDRIRSVDVTAGPVHRLFRLSVVKIGTGERTDGLESCGNACWTSWTSASWIPQVSRLHRGQLSWPCCTGPGFVSLRSQYPVWWRWAPSQERSGNSSMRSAPMPSMSVASARN